MKPTRRDDICTGLIIALLILHAMRGSFALPGIGGTKGENLRVLITYDPKVKHTIAQQDVIGGDDFRGWLETKVTKDGSVPAWRIVSLPTAFNDDQPEFKAMLAEKRDADDWVYIKNSAASAGFPLPADENAAKELIGRYAK